MEDAIFNNNVIYMKNLIGKRVMIETTDNTQHEGVVYVVDPVYKTTVLVNEHDKPSLEFVLHHAVKTFTVLSDTVNLSYFRDARTTTDNTGDTLQRKFKLTKWLKHMFINVQEDGDLLTVEDHLRIEPPYTKENCLCENTIVLQRIQNIIDLMPEDFA